MNPVSKAIKKMGGRGALAGALSVSYQAVQQWEQRKRFPAERVLKIEAVTGISRHELRPDIYPQEVAA